MAIVSNSQQIYLQNMSNVIEGKLRFEELREYLIDRNLPLRVSLSEDATRIQATVSYDLHTNQLVGFSLPLDENGLPIPFTFMARNSKEIEQHFKNDDNMISSNVYVQMAQPLSRLYPPFCFLHFFTDNTFTAEAVLSRWKYTKDELQNIGIAVDNFASDGDSRPLKVMKLKSEMGVQDLSFFDCKYYVVEVLLQQHTHKILFTLVQNAGTEYWKLLEWPPSAIGLFPLHIWCI